MSSSQHSLAKTSSVDFTFPLRQSWSCAGYFSTTKGPVRRMVFLLKRAGSSAEKRNYTRVPNVSAKADECVEGRVHDFVSKQTFL